MEQKYTCLFIIYALKNNFLQLKNHHGEIMDHGRTYLPQVFVSCMPNQMGPPCFQTPYTYPFYWEERDSQCKHAIPTSVQLILTMMRLWQYISKLMIVRTHAYTFRNDNHFSFLATQCHHENTQKFKSEYRLPCHTSSMVWCPSVEKGVAMSIDNADTTCLKLFSHLYMIPLGKMSWAFQCCLFPWFRLHHWA